MSRFGVPRKYQQTALLIGIVLALVFRGMFIARRRRRDQPVQLGVLPLRRVPGLHRRPSWPGRARRDDEDYQENAADAVDPQRLPATDEYHGVDDDRGAERQAADHADVIVIVALGTTDLLFALDSIPAIYGLTQEPYLVFTANIFALMGLRQLYFLIGGLLRRLVYLSLGLSVLLAFIGVKLVLHAMHENELPFINGGEHVSGRRTSRSGCRSGSSSASSASPRWPACVSPASTLATAPGPRSRAGG